MTQAFSTLPAPRKRRWATLGACVGGVLAGVVGSLLFSRLSDRPAAELPAHPRSTASALSDAEERARLLAMNEARLRAHDAEPVVSAWAMPATDHFRADLAGASADGGFQVKDVNCRQHTCVATLEWPSFLAASRGHRALLTTVYTENCAHGILLPEPPDPDAPYRAKAYFDCRQHD